MSLTTLRRLRQEKNKFKATWTSVKFKFNLCKLVGPCLNIKNQNKRRGIKLTSRTLAQYVSGPRFHLQDHKGQITKTLDIF